MSHTSSVSKVPIKSLNALNQTVAELQQSGIDCELVPNSVARMYYKDQMEKHVKSKDANAYQFHDNPEEMDFVLKLKDCMYDIGFLKNAEGHLVPFFDDYNQPSPYVPETRDGSKTIRSVLGAKFDGPVKHWSGNRDSTEDLMASVGKLLQGYSKNAAIEAAIGQGYSIAGQHIDKEGNVHIQVHV